MLNKIEEKRDNNKQMCNLQLSSKSLLQKKIRETTEKAPKVADKITSEYNGKKVYTGPRGGKYYINANGNKTYIQE